MFERYTEKARRVIFFARYEASQFGSTVIETEHILLGLLREDKVLRHKLLPGMNEEVIRQKIEAATTQGKKISTSVDMPLTNECKRVLAYAAEEAERLANRNITTGHLLLGLLREERSFAAQLLAEAGLGLKAARKAVEQMDQAAATARTETAEPARPATDLSQMAADGSLRPFVDREKEMESLIVVLGRSDKNSAALVGEPGVGRRSMAEGLSQKIVEGKVPSFLTGRSVLELDAAQFTSGQREPTEKFLKQQAESPRNQHPLLFVEDLLSMLARSEELAAIVKPLLLSGQIQCISTATPQEWNKALEACGWLDRCFRPIEIEPMSVAAATEVVLSAKDRFEKFHALTYTVDALQHAVLYSSAYVVDRHLPDKALDLIDEAAAYVHAQSLREPDEVVECRKRIHSLVHNMQDAIAGHEFEKARHISDDERRERAQLRELLKKHGLKEPPAIEVQRSDVEEVLARWTGIPINVIRQTGSGPSQTA